MGRLDYFDRDFDHFFGAESYSTLALTTALSYLLRDIADILIVDLVGWHGITFLKRVGGSF